MKEYKEFKLLFADICEIRANVIKLSGKDLYKARCWLYSQPFSQWKLNLIWEYVWSDITYDEIYNIFKNNRLI